MTWYVRHDKKIVGTVNAADEQSALLRAEEKYPCDWSVSLTVELRKR